MNSLKTFTKWLHRFEDGMLAFILLAMIILSVTDILMRNFFSGGILWIPPLLRVLVLWIGMLGALMASRQQEHIAVDVLSRMLPAKGKRISSIASSLFTAIICLIVAYHSYLFVVSTFEYQDMGFNNIPAWIFQAVIPFAFFMMAIRFFIHSVGYLLSGDYLKKDDVIKEQTPSEEMA